MANNHAVVRTDRLFGTDNRAGLISVKYFVFDSESGPAEAHAIENGNVLKATNLLVLDEDAGTAEREIFQGFAVAANDKLKDVVLVASPEVMYDERKRNLDEFINEKGAISRGYRLHKHDIFSVTKDALDGVATPAVGNVVELKAGTKLNVAATATQGSTQVGKIIDVNIVGRYTYYVIEVA